LGGDGGKKESVKNSKGGGVLDAGGRRGSLVRGEKEPYRVPYKGKWRYPSKTRPDLQKKVEELNKPQKKNPKQPKPPQTKNPTPKRKTPNPQTQTPKNQIRWLAVKGKS